MITRQQIKQLAAWETGGTPVVSLFLDVDGGKYSPIQYVEKTHQLVRQARSSLAGMPFSAEEKDCLLRDLDNITRFVGAQFKRGDWKGLAIFSCSGRKLQQVFTLQTPVTDQIEVRPHPVLRPLIEIVETGSPILVVLVDREKARQFRIIQEAIDELGSITEDVPGRVRPESWYGLSDKSIERHVDEHIHRHLVDVATTLEQTVKNELPEGILLGGTPDVVPEFRRVLPQRLADLVVGELHHLMIIASPSEVLEQARKALHKIEREKEEALVQQLCEATGNGDGVLGLEDTLAALYSSALRLLVVTPYRTWPGYVCSDCGRLFQTGRCPVCESMHTRAVEDLMEESIRTAIRQDAQVKIVSGMMVWNQMVGIGGLLRFSLPILRKETPAMASRPGDSER